MAYEIPRTIFLSGIAVQDLSPAELARNLFLFPPTEGHKTVFLAEAEDLFLPHSPLNHQNFLAEAELVVAADQRLRLLSRCCFQSLSGQFDSALFFREFLEGAADKGQSVGFLSLGGARIPEALEGFLENHSECGTLTCPPSGFPDRDALGRWDFLVCVVPRGKRIEELLPGDAERGEFEGTWIFCREEQLGFFPESSQRSQHSASSGKIPLGAATRIALANLPFLFLALRERFPAAGDGAASQVPDAVPGDLPDAKTTFWNGELIASELEKFEEPDFRKPCIIDLSGVQSVDSAGLGLILRVLRKAWSRSASLCFVNPSPALSRVLALSRLESIIPVLSDHDQALRYLAAQSTGFLLGGKISENGKTLEMDLREGLVGERCTAFLDAVLAQWELNESLLVLELRLDSTRALDSSALAALQIARKSVRKRKGGHLRLRNPSPKIQRLLRAAGLSGNLSG